MESLFKFNTQSGQNSFITKKIKGKIDCIIIDSQDKVEIIIESELGYIIFKRKAHEGIKYYPIRIESIPNTDGKFSGIETAIPVKFNLNERLIITISGGKDKQVDMIIRY